MRFLSQRAYLLVATAAAISLLPASPLSSQDKPDQTDVDARAPRVVGDANPGRPFVPAVAAGDFLYLSGAIGLDRESGRVPTALAAESKEVFDSLRRLLKLEELDFDRVVEAELFLSDSRYFRDVSNIWTDEVLSIPGILPPARATVESAIALPTARVELAVTAARKGVPVERIVPEGWPATSGRPYSWGVLAGDTLFVAGMVASDPKAGRWVGGDITAQTNQTMRNVETVLDTAGFGWKDVARCRVFLADARDYRAMNAAYGSFFGDAAPPARSTVQARLMLPEGRVEVQCIAVRDAKRRAVLPAGTSPSNLSFSPSILAGGRLFAAGMVGRGPDGYPEGAAAQTRITLDRVKAVLDAADLDWRDVVSVRVFLSDIRYYDDMNRVYSEVVGSPAPARATVGTPLASPEALVEIEVTAHAE
ncbi:MAG: RidA family protein [Thermoanaerobaculia bacterium]|nr:RidA family protein [Thermoanaerobaculia bacterium]